MAVVGAPALAGLRRCRSWCAALALLALSGLGCGGVAPYDPSGDYEYLIAQGDMPLSCDAGGDSSGPLEIYTGAGDSLRGTFGMCGGGFTSAIAEGHLRGEAFSFYLGGFIVRGTVLPAALTGLADGYGFTGLAFRAQRAGTSHGKVLP